MPTPRSSTTLLYLATLTLSVAALYFGKPVLMPLALATLFAFLLAPIVNAVARTGLRQPAAVTIVVVLMFSALGAITWGFGTQLRSLAYELPDYKQNVHEKILDLRSAGKGPALERIRQTWRELRGELRKPAVVQTNTAAVSANNTNAPPATDHEPVRVVVQNHESGNIWIIPTALGPLMQVLATVGLIIVLVIFMLLRKRELRNRLIVLFGHSRLPTTTRALDEAAERISRYLLMQGMVNSAYGVAVGLALYFVGLPYGLLWGFVAALLRFIPYVGVWIGTAMPVLLSLAVFPGWLHAFLIIGLIVVFELIVSTFLEPLLYGQTAGVSEVALLVAVAFWTWVWGPIGLALATPLTVCLVVLGKYVPGLSFLALLLGDEAVMDPPMEFYQRLLAMDDVEAGQIAKTFSESHELIDLYDQLFVPALISARRDSLNEKLSTDHLDFIINTTGQLITKIGGACRTQYLATQMEPRNLQEVFGIPVEDTIDELVMCMLGHILPAHLSLRAISATALPGEILPEVKERQPCVICIGAVLPGGGQEGRYLLKRVQADFPSIPIVFARWGLRRENKQREISRSGEVQAVVPTLKEARNAIVQFAQLSSEKTAVVDFPGRETLATGAASN